MRKVTLSFPDVTSLSEFILTYKVSRVVINSSEKLLKGVIPQTLVQVACRQYGARVRESVPAKG